MTYQTILLIDDDLDDQEIFVSAIETISKDLHCSSLSNAKEALQKLDDQELKPDVIFLDLNMPVMNGIEFLKEMKQIDHLRSIPIIIFSTTSNAATIASTKELGAIHFITKPNRFSDLIDILNSIINK